MGRKMETGFLSRLMQLHVSHSKLKSDQTELHAPLSSTRDIRKKAKYLGQTIRQDLE